MASYRSFFKKVCRLQRDSSTEERRPASRCPIDPEISEIVLLKNDSNGWLELQRELAQAHEAKIIAELKEKRPHSWRPRVCGWVLRDVNEEKLFGWASGHSSKYYAQRIQTLERQLEERKIYMEKNAEVVGAFITFNTTEAVDKVLFELKPTSLLGTVVASLLTDSGSFLYDTKLTHAEVDDQLDDGQQDMELPGSMRDAAKTVATRVRRITLNLTELAKKHSGQTKSPITEGEGRVSFSSEDHAPLRPRWRLALRSMALRTCERSATPATADGGLLDQTLRDVPFMDATELPQL